MNTPLLDNNNAGSKSLCIHDFFENTVKKNPQSIAILFNDISIIFA